MKGLLRIVVSSVIMCIMFSMICFAEEAVSEEDEEIRSYYSDVFDSMSESEYDELIKLVYLEAAIEPYEGQIAVVEEILTRVRSPRWPNTVHEVIWQKGQFSQTAKNISRITEGGPYKPYGDTHVDLSQIKNAVEHVRVNGYTVLPKYASQYGYTITAFRDYVYFATYKANGKNFIKIGGHYFGMGDV